MFEIVKFKIEDKDKASIVFDIRQRVFVDEQKVSREEEYDEYEDQSMHYMLLVEKQPAGTARWRFTNDGIKLERFAILPQFRNNGAGSALVKAVLSDVLPHQKMIYLNAQVFYEANIPHYKMIYKGK